ncbi:hypothetical protein GCM10022226_12010 [Sphaerisporangium flaviroseum]|uniref:Glycine zipper family protein n=1 Tax=Sphaerisporangium flaviroseum TaxID=509199 RepID=A0ABP7HKL1_9ACTN
MGNKASNGSTGNDKLPLRWALVIFVGTAVGIVTGIASGLGVGVEVGLVCAGFLHMVLPSDKN